MKKLVQRFAWGCFGRQSAPWICGRPKRNGHNPSINDAVRSLWRGCSGNPDTSNFFRPNEAMRLNSFAVEPFSLPSTAILTNAGYRRFPPLVRGPLATKGRSPPI